MTRNPSRSFRSREWFAAPGRSDMAALYLERFMNDGVTPEELRSGKPIIGIAQSGSDLARPRSSSCLVPSCLVTIGAT